MRKIQLTEEQTQEIIKLYKSGLGQNKIEGITGIKRYIVNRVLKENNILITGTKRNIL